MGDPKAVRAHCNKCLITTSHVIIGEHGRNYSDSEGDRWVAVRYEMLLCRGCEDVTFRTVSTDSETIDPEGRPVERTVYYPPEISRRQPSWLYDLRTNYKQRVLHSLLIEVYTALHQDLRTLAAAGVRTIIDNTMTAKVGDQGTFAATLKKFVQKGFIAQTLAEFLEKTIDAGSASAHRAFTPTPEDLNLLLDTAENLIESVFIYPDRMKNLSKRVPRRRKKK